MRQKRIVGLDALKFLCAFLVVCIHIRPQGETASYLLVLARIAVPVFFMITGFFYENMVKKKAVRTYIFKIITMIVSANLLYFVLHGVTALCRGELWHYIQEVLGVKAIIRFIVFNDTPIAGHLWYLNALLYTVVFMVLMDKVSDRRKLYKIIPLLLAIDLVLGKYSLLIFGREINFILVRNWIFVGVPYFLIGDYIKRLSENGKIQTISTKKLSVFCVLFASTNILERWFLVFMNANAMRDHYVSTTLLAIAIFLLFMQMNGQGFNFVARMGKKCSTMIYLMHPAIITVLGILTHDQITKISGYNILAPVLVFGLSWAFAMLVSCISQKLKCRKTV